MTTWAEDPELLATFRAEVQERIASLQSGLLALETTGAPRQVVGALFRDAHTVKGSARMLGLSGVLAVAHRSEDLLGAVRDGRIEVRRDVVDLLLAACDAITGALPGAEDPIPDEHLEAIADAIGRALAGENPVRVPQLQRPEPVAEEAGSAAVEETDRWRGGDSVRVATDKVYELLDVVGEAELDSRRVERAAGDLDGLAGDHGRWLRQLRESTAGLQLPPDAALAVTRLTAVSDQLVAAARDLRELAHDSHNRLAQVRDGAMGLAMVPVRRVTAGLPRVVRDVATAGGKDVRLVLEGQDVELDKHVLDGVSDALKHLVVNAVDHGCEPPTDRARAGKPAQATVTVAARAAGGTVVIEVADDGAGIDEESLRATAIARGALPADSTASGSALLDVLFAPEFTTATTVTETSGRGVGLDVVRTSVEALGGTVELRTAVGLGTTFVLTLPVTLGVLRCLMARVGEERYALPVPGVVESISLKDSPVHSLAGNPVVVRHGTTLPLLDLGAALGVAGERQTRAAVIVRHGDRQIAWAVDSLDGERELVVKDLGGFLGRPPLVSGATIDGDGTVVCLVDLRELGETTGDRPGRAAAGAVVPGQQPRVGGEAPVKKPRILVVEDSVGVRELERVILTGAGYDVVTAVDGADGARRLTGPPFDLVVSDVEMPGMDGYTLTRTIRRTKGWEQVPVVIMTSRGSDEDQKQGMDAGASAYLLKTAFDQEQLVQTVRRLLGR